MGEPARQLAFADAIVDLAGRTGTGKLVFDTSPTLVTPALGTPTSGVLTNCTGLPNTGITGVVRVLSAGQVTTDVTGSGSLALDTFSIDQNLLAQGRSVLFCFLFARTAGSGTVTIRPSWGGVNFETTSSGVAGPTWTVVGEITADGGLTAQRGWMHVRGTASTTAISQFGFDGANNTIDGQFTSDNSAAAIALALGVTLTTNTNHVTMRSRNIWLLGA